MFDPPSQIDLTLDSRAVNFENPTGARGSGGTLLNGRKGAPSRIIKAGEKLVLADIEGPGKVRHCWMTFPPGSPQAMRSVWMEVFYDDNAYPSISVPCLDFFGLPHGRPAPYFSAMTSAQEGRGFNSYVPMPFTKRIRLELTNSGSDSIPLYYQIDYTRGKLHPSEGYLHVSFRRENPTTLKRDFVIADGLRGPGRFFGCVVGIRVLPDGMFWYGEGEVKIYRDGDKDLPTICGTGLEDYVGSAWGMNPHTALYAGVPVSSSAPTRAGEPRSSLPEFVSFYRWHVPDPIVFHDDLKVTIQQIGFVGIGKGPNAEKEFAAASQKYIAAGPGWKVGGPELEGSPFYATGIAERRDDYCASAFVYCQRPQAVPRLHIKDVLADL
jgi:hypothetical protein